MYFSKSTIISLGLLATAELVAGHAAIIGATGDAGGQGSAIGVDPQTPRDGTRRQPFQQDSTRFRNENADQCGETLGGGANDVESGTAQVMAQNGNTLPQVTPGGEISMTLHQVNGDGAGPYTCMIDSTGTGTQWTPIQVTQNIDGNARGRNNDQQMQDLPLTAAIPANQQCTGTVAGQSNVCMVRCQNPARAGPFGGCVPVQMAGAAAPAANANAGNANANTGNANAGNANANTGNANTGNANTGNANTGNANTQVPATGNANTGNNVQQAPATGNVGNANGNLNGQANANTGNANTVPQTGNTGNANTQNTNGNVGATTGNANTAGTPALTNDDQQEEVGTLQRRVAKQLGTNGPIVTDDDQEEEVELLEGSFARRWVVPSN